MTHKDEQTLLEIKRMVEDVRDQMQELREAISFTPKSDTNVRLSQPYEHPWDKHIRQQPISSGDRSDSETICDI